MKPTIDAELGQPLGARGFRSDLALGDLGNLRQRQFKRHAAHAVRPLPASVNGSRRKLTEMRGRNIAIADGAFRATAE